LCLSQTRTWISNVVVFFIWKENLNSDGQQFHQYQQNEQPPLVLKYWT
jgi:hypothetical protein